MVELFVLLACSWAEPEPPPLTPEQIAYERRMEIVHLIGKSEETLSRRGEFEERLLSEPDPRVRKSLARALAATKDSRVIPALTSALNTDTDPDVQNAIATIMLVRLDRRQPAVDAVVEWYLRGVEPSIDVDILSSLRGGPNPAVVCCSLARYEHLSPERGERVRVAIYAEDHECRDAEALCPGPGTFPDGVVDPSSLPGFAERALDERAVKDCVSPSSPTP